MTFLAVVIPVKCPSEGKSRLASVLRPDERRDLNWWLIRNTFSQVAALGKYVHGYVVSSSDDVLREAQSIGFAVCREFRADGLSAAVALAARQAGKDGAGAILVLPVDLPLLSSEHLYRTIEESGSGNDVVLITDRSGSGTNLMLWRPLASAQFCYGPGSAKLHAGIATGLGLKVLVRQDSEISFDLDTPLDWRNWSLTFKRGRPIFGWQNNPDNQMRGPDHDCS